MRKRTADTPDGETVTERLKVARWRSERFQELGYDEIDADRLAQYEADWHLAERMIAGGCPLVTVEAILT